MVGIACLGGVERRAAGAAPALAARPAAGALLVSQIGHTGPRRSPRSVDAGLPQHDHDRDTRHRHCRSRTVSDGRFGNRRRTAHHRKRAEPAPAAQRRHHGLLAHARSSAGRKISRERNQDDAMTRTAEGAVCHTRSRAPLRTQEQP